MTADRQLPSARIMRAGDIRRLDPSGWYKPLDVGEAGTAASVDADGRLLVVAFHHPLHGQVQLSSAPGLSARSRYDQAAVRRYRRRLSSRAAPAFGLSRAAGDARTRAPAPAWLWHEAIPLTALASGGPDRASPAVVTIVPHPDDVAGVRGVVQLRLPAEMPDPAAPPATRWGGRMRLARAPYPQLTEGGPLPEVDSRPRLDHTADAIVLDDARLGAAVVIGGDLALDDPATVATLTRGWMTADVPVQADWRAVVIGLGADAAEASHAMGTLARTEPSALLRDTDRRWSRRWHGWLTTDGPMDVIARRGLAYALGSCAVAVDGGTCLLADHRLLPLSWTRDAYFVARALLDWGVACDVAEPIRLVRRHLDWLFRVADRPEGWWARSHLAGGQRKDDAFQADQQLYPLLELADYTEASGDDEPLRAYGADVPRVLAALDTRAHQVLGMYATDETPADEPAKGLYLVSTQILAWRTLTRLAALGIGGPELAHRAERLRENVRRHLVTEHGGSDVFAYAIDAGGRFVFDHDANDLPLAMAADWGFCATDDPVWRATMRGALSATHEGYSAGPWGGLGSAHTPGPWPLGQLQAIIVGGNAGGVQVSMSPDRTPLDVLAAEAQWDGLLPEASDSTTARPISRPWFAWPGAVTASHYLRESARPDRAPDSHIDSHGGATRRDAVDLMDDGRGQSAADTHVDSHVERTWCDAVASGSGDGRYRLATAGSRRPTGNSPRSTSQGMTTAPETRPKR